MLNLSFKGVVTLTIVKPNGETYEYTQENSLSTKWIQQIYNMLASGNRHDHASPSLIYPTNGTWQDGYFLVDATQGEPDVGIPLVHSGQANVVINNVTYNVYVPFVPRNITCLFVETNDPVNTDGTYKDTAVNYTDKNGGRKYRYVFGNTRVHFGKPDGSGTGVDAVKWPGTSPSLSSIEFIADGLTPIEAHSAGVGGASGCPLFGRNVASDVGAASAANRPGRFNSVIRTDGGTADQNDVGISGDKTFRVDEIGLITGYGPGLTAAGALDGDGIDTFKTSPYHYQDRADKRISGSYNRPVYVGVVRDVTGHEGDGFPTNTLGTLTWRTSYAGDNNIDAPATNDRAKYAIDKNDSIKLSYKILITHNFKERSTRPDVGSSSISEHENEYSYRVVSAILKRPVGIPAGAAGASSHYPSANLDANSGGNYFRSTDYSKDGTAGANHPLNSPIGTLPEMPKMWKQEYSISEWRYSCHYIAINGFAVQHTYDNNTAGKNAVNADDNIVALKAAGTESQFNASNVVNFTSYSRGDETFNRARNSTEGETSYQLGGFSDGTSASYMVSKGGSSESNTSANSSFMFPSSNHALGTSQNIVGDTHFIYKGIPYNRKPTWCTYFIDADGEDYTYGNSNPDATGQPSNKITHQDVGDSSVADMSIGRPVDSGSNPKNLLVASIDLQVESKFDSTGVGAGLSEDTPSSVNQYNNFTAADDGTNPTLTTTWDTNTNATNNLMMSHYLSISVPTNVTAINTATSPDSSAVFLYSNTEGT